MGHSRKILGFRIVEPISTLWSDLFAIELAENFHIHLRNLRLELDHVEFESLADGFGRALKNWKKRGKPRSKRYQQLNDRFLSLHKSKISPIPSLWNTNTANDEMRVELQQWADYLHLHYRNIKLEFTVSEFLDFATVIEEAKLNLERELSHERNPKRLGKFHRANPDGRVSKVESTYWSKPPNWELSLKPPYATTYMDEADANLRKQRSRETADPLLRYMDICDLYNMKLYHSGPLNPWMVDSMGVCRPLHARYEFVAMVFASDSMPTVKDIQATEYWELLGRQLGEVPRDGSSEWVYADREAQSLRFVELIKLVAKRGYVGIRQDDNDGLEQFDRDHPVKVIRHGEVEFLKTSYYGYPGLLSVRPVAGAYCVWNGLHRIAILKYLWDSGLLEDNRVLVRGIDRTPFGPNNFELTPPPSLGIRRRAVSYASRYPLIKRAGSKVLSTFPGLERILFPQEIR